MTLKELSQLYYLNREIEMDKARLDELEARVLSGCQTLTGMPHTPGTADKLGELVPEIADLREVIAAKHRRCLRERARLERYIADCGDAVVREIFQLRFVNGLSWEQVAASTASRMLPDSCRQACYRYLRKN